MQRARGSSLLLLLAQQVRKTARNRRKHHQCIGDLPQFEFDAAPRGERCEKCVLEAMVASDPDAES